LLVADPTLPRSGSDCIQIQGTKFSQATLEHFELSNRAKKYFLKNFLTGYGALPYKTALAQNVITAR